MSLIHYSVVGVTASVAAVAGVFLQLSLSQPGSDKADGHDAPEHTEKGVKLPQIAVPIYSTTEKVGYCVMSVEYLTGDVDQEDSALIVPRVTNDLYIEFGAALPADMDPIEDCAGRAGKRTDTFIINEAEFYEKINGEDTEEG